MSERRVVNMSKLHLVEKSSSVDVGDFSFTLSFYGDGPKGNDLLFKIKIPIWGIGNIADQLNNALAEQEKNLVRQRKAMKGEE